LKIDLGAGPNKKEGFVGLDQFEFDGIDHVLNLGSDPLPFGSGEVTEAHASHFVEHLDAIGRCHLFNELYRVMEPGAKMTMIVPHWGSSRAYGDPTHAWPPLGEFWFYYLGREWRMANAPHTDKKHLPWGYDCDFEATWGYSMHPSLATRNAEYQQMAMNFYREGAQDMHATLTRRP
jgi:hypothetical protein